MRAENTLQFMADFYPSIFPTRKHCLNFLFCGVGNGYEWVKGELVDEDGKFEKRYRLIKSELAAGVALYMTCGDNEWGAEVYGCASDRQQASIVFDVAVDMVEQCPALKKRIKPVMSVKRLVYKPTNSFYQVLSAEAYTKHGLNVHAVIFDELHSQPNRELFDVMTKG